VPGPVRPVGSPACGQPGLWAARPVGSPACGQPGPWAARPVPHLYFRPGTVQSQNPCTRHCVPQGSHFFTDKKSRTPMINFPGPFRSPRMLKYTEKTLPSHPDPRALSPSPPLEVEPFKSSYGIWPGRALWAPPVWGLVRSPSRNRIWCILALKYYIWWQQF